MNGDGGQVLPEPPRLWFLANGVLHATDSPGAVAIQLSAEHGSTVWPQPSRQTAYAWFLEHYQVVVSFEAFDAALKRDFPLTYSRMRDNEVSEEAFGRDFANVHTLPPRATPVPPVE